eukprot:3562322-Pleurochrysis_carterae.AAC.4
MACSALLLESGKYSPSRDATDSRRAAAARPRAFIWARLGSRKVKAADLSDQSPSSARTPAGLKTGLLIAWSGMEQGPLLGIQLV